MAIYMYSEFITVLELNLRSMYGNGFYILKVCCDMGCPENLFGLLENNV
jgi:hypothetical protein